MNPYQKIIDQALAHIKRQQSHDGSFTSLSSFLADDFQNAIPRQTTFFTANILCCLQNIPKQTAEVQHRGAEFLLAEKSERWSFNYWARNADKDKETTIGNGACADQKSDIPYPAYPDDLDDTFAALAPLARHDATIIDGHAAAAIAKLLTAQEAREGGPYRTWLVAKTAAAAWHDVDIVVNSTIGYFLSLIDVQLPALEHFIDTAVLENNISSPYYPGIFHTGYFLSRYYKARKNNGSKNIESETARAMLADVVATRLLQNNDFHPTPLEQAMAITSLINLGHAEKIPQAAVDSLAATLTHEGFLPYAFCIDPAREGKRCYAGASSLTAAFCAEALACYSIYERDAFFAEHRNILSDAAPSSTVGTNMGNDHIRGMARASCRILDPELQAIALATIEKTDDERVTTLAYEFREALYKNGVIIPLEIVEQLSLANLYGWMAYTIYDDALDGEDGSSLIPCANFFLRSLAEIYSSLDARIVGARSLFNNIMNRIDNANSWEQKYCRVKIDDMLSHNTPLSIASRYALPLFGNYQTLADRSIGHAMGPLAELLYGGYATDSKEYKSVELFFEHYLIARQLHDDAHDWADDLLRGRVNSVSALILQRTEVNIYLHAATTPDLKTLFWREVIDDVVRTIGFHIAAARAAREDSIILADTDFMESALQKLASGARRAIDERDETLIFLKDYHAAI